MGQVQRPLKIGEKVKEYEIKGVLGTGGFGITYLAIDTVLEKKVAIKEFFPETAWRDSKSRQVKNYEDHLDFFKEGLKRFEKEGKLLAKFKHHNIVHVIRTFSMNGTAYLVMEYEEGETLLKYLNRVRRSLTYDEIRNLFIPILDGLREVHETGLLHLDIKPENIFLRHQGTPFLIDFGGARHQIGTASKSVSFLVASDGYAPLEQYSASNLGKHTDIYAVAACIYHCVTNNQPISSLVRSNAIVDEEDDPLIFSEKNFPTSKYPVFFTDALKKSLSLTIKNRPATIKYFHSELFDSAINSSGEKTKSGKILLLSLLSIALILMSALAIKVSQDLSEIENKKIVLLALKNDIQEEKEENHKYLLDIENQEADLELKKEKLEESLSLEDETLKREIEEKQRELQTQKENLLEENEKIQEKENELAKKEKDLEGQLQQIGNNNIWKKNTSISVSTIISHNFDHLGVFKSGVATAQVGDKWGLINDSGRSILSPHFDSLHSCYEGWCAAEKDKKWKFINAQGVSLNDKLYEKVLDFKSGLAAVKKDGKWGYVNLSGNLVIPFQFKNVRDFSFDLAAVKKDSKWGYINKRGYFSIDAKFDDAYAHSEGVATVIVEGKRGFINVRGDYIIYPQYTEQVRRFKEKRARILVNDKWHFIDMDNKIITRSFKEAKNYSNGLAPVKIGDEWGYLDWNGDLVIASLFDKAYQFYDGYAQIELNGYRGFIDIFGRIIVNPNYQSAYSYSEGKMPVKKEGKWGVLKITHQAGSDYILPLSSESKLTRTQLKDLNKIELRMARHEIYARHGEIFIDPLIKYYFSKKSWYEEKNSINLELNEVEKYNLNLIENEEKNRTVVGGNIILN